MALEELRSVVDASRYLLGGSVVNDVAARNWFTQIDFDGSGTSLFLLPGHDRAHAKHSSHVTRMWRREQAS